MRTITVSEPREGDLADHVSGDLDPREVIEVRTNVDGSASIQIDVLGSPSGWLDAAHYAYLRRARSTHAISNALPTRFPIVDEVNGRGRYDVVPVVTLEVAKVLVESLDGHLVWDGAELVADHIIAKGPNPERMGPDEDGNYVLDGLRPFVDASSEPDRGQDPDVYAAWRNKSGFWFASVPGTGDDAADEYTAERVLSAAMGAHKIAVRLVRAAEVETGLEVRVYTRA